MNQLSLRLHQLARALDERFVPHVHQAGTDGRNAESSQTLLRSRALAAMAIHMVAGVPERAAGARVTDYFHDDGIDGFAVAPNPSPAIYLVQAKWSANGGHSFDVAETMRLVTGFARLRSGELHSNNLLRHHRHRGEIDQLMATPSARVVLVFATSGYRKVPPNTGDEIEQAVQRLTRNETPVDCRYLVLKDFVKRLEADVARRGVTVSAPLLRNRSVDEQYPALQGTISAAELGQWYLDHGRAIFDDNVRVEMDSDVNHEIVDCLLHEPENFWYFNNGVTALCEDWQRAPGEVREVPYDFQGLRIVNGAQTVSSIGKAMRQDRDAVARAQVPIRFVALQHQSPVFGARIAYATNRANPMRPRDFLAMDHVQQRLHDEFTLTWGSAYAIRADDHPPTGDAGCSVVEAVIAMACGRHDVSTLVEAKHDVSHLWRAQGERYRELFNDRTSVVEVWRRVRTLRMIMDRLSRTDRVSTEREKAVAVLGDLLVAHLVFRQLGDDGIDDIQSNWEPSRSSVAELTDRALQAMVAEVNRELAGGPVSRNNCKGVAKRLRNGDWVSNRIQLPLDHVEESAPWEREAMWPSLPEFYLDVRERSATGTRCDGGFLVHAGSHAAVVDHSSLSTLQLRHRRNLRDSLGFIPGGGFLWLTRDTLFDSPSQAAAVLLGHAVNGADGWRTEDRRTFNEVTQAEQTMLRTQHER